MYLNISPEAENGLVYYLENEAERYFLIEINKQVDKK